MQVAEREEHETAPRREKAQAKGDDQCVSTGFSRPAVPPGLTPQYSVTHSHQHDAQRHHYVS